MKKLMDIISGLSGILLCVFFVFVALDVFCRSVLHVPVVWFNEGSTFLFMWMAFISGSIAFFEDTHYKINLFPEKFEKKIDFFLSVCEAVFTVIFAGILLWQGIKFVQYGTMKFSPALGINMSYVILVLPLCAAIILIGILYRFLMMIKGRRKGGGAQ